MTRPSQAPALDGQVQRLASRRVDDSGMTDGYPPLNVLKHVDQPGQVGVDLLLELLLAVGLKGTGQIDHAPALLDRLLRALDDEVEDVHRLMLVRSRAGQQQAAE